MLIRKHQLDASLVKSYAADYCGTPALRDATKGQIHIEPAFYYGDVKYTFTGQTRNGNVSGGFPVTGQYDQFTAEADHFAACIRNNKTPDTPGEEGLADMLAIEAIYKAAGTPIA